MENFSWLLSTPWPWVGAGVLLLVLNHWGGNIWESAKGWIANARLPKPDLKPSPSVPAFVDIPLSKAVENFMILKEFCKGDKEADALLIQLWTRLVAKEVMK